MTAERSVRTAMRRVLVIGAGGAGKTTFALQLGAATGLPVVHLDAHYWQPGWTATPAEAWERRVDELASRTEWIMDGNYGGTLERRLAAADTVVFLDTPAWLSLARVVRRRWRHRGRSRPSMAEGCPERLTLEFLVWIVTYGRRRRPALLERFRGLGPDTTVHVLRSEGERRAFLAEARA